MANKPKIRAKAIRNVTSRYARKVSWNDFRLAMVAGTDAERQMFAKLLTQGSPAVLRRYAMSLVRRAATLRAEVDVDAALADDNLTLDEFEDLFG